MTSVNKPFWSNLANTINHPVDGLKRWYENTDNGAFSLSRLRELTGVAEAPLKQALAMMAAQQWLEIHNSEHCVHCAQTPDDSSLANGTCSVCQDDAPLTLVTTTTYVINKARTRDIHWMLVIHGMNTVGAWQQEFSWLLANHYRHAVPVYIYKYGNLKIKPLLLLHQNRQVAKLAQAIRQLQQQAPDGRPDVLAHSYGTFLLSRLCQDHQYDDVKLGRLILVGSIVRPDFNWAPMLQSGRIEGVMCHHSDQDHTVRLAHFTIPGAGPSGRVGFNDRVHVIHHHETDLSHSRYFEASRMAQIFPQVWLPFLTAAKPSSSETKQTPDWRPSGWRFVTHPLKLMLLLALMGMGLLLVASSIHGMAPTWERVLIEVQGWFAVN